jgi:hypothetical protein
VKDLVSKADDAPPEDIVRDFVQLLGEFIKNGRATLPKEVASVVVYKLHFFLSFQSA